MLCELSLAARSRPLRSRHKSPPTHPFIPRAGLAAARVWPGRLARDTQPALRNPRFEPAARPCTPVRVSRMEARRRPLCPDKAPNASVLSAGLASPVCARRRVPCGTSDGGGVALCACLHYPTSSSGTLPAQPPTQVLSTTPRPTVRTRTHLRCLTRPLS